MNNEEVNEFFKCNCAGEGIMVTAERDYEEIWIALYTHGHVSGKPSIWSRIKYAWMHLTTGRKYADMVTLDPEDASRLADCLNRFVADYTSFRKK